MPRYEFGCDCGAVETIRRSVEAMDDPLSCACGRLMARRFTPTSAIHIPIAFQQVREGGAPGGGQYSWSDFHDCTERELAHLKDANGREIHVEPTNRARSMPSPKPAFSTDGLGAAMKEAKEILNGRRTSGAA